MAVNTFCAVKMRDTLFIRDLLHRSEAETIAQIVESLGIGSE